MSLRNVISGTKAARIGKDFERVLALTHTAYADHGLARIDKLPVPTVYAGSGYYRVVARQGYDYIGSFGPNSGPKAHPSMYLGLSIAMEAKANDKTKSSLAIVESTKTSGGVSVHQLAALSEGYTEWGMVSAIVWGNGDDLLVLPPDGVVRAMERFQGGERKSIPASDFLSVDRVTYPQHPIVVDWLFEIRCWLEVNGVPGPARSTRRQYDMIAYRLDVSRKVIRIRKDDEDERVVPTELLDRVILDQIARESRSVDEFIEKVQHVGTANEG